MANRRVRLFRRNVKVQPQYSDGFVLFLVSKCSKYLLIQSKMDGFGEHF